MATYKIFNLCDFEIGQRVRHRQWTVPIAGPQRSMVHKRLMQITDIIGGAIWCGQREFSAFELIPAEYRPSV